MTKKLQKNRFGGGVVFGFVLAALFFLGIGASRGIRLPFVSGLIEKIESRVTGSVRGGAGPVLAKIEGKIIRKKLFEKRYRLFVDSLPGSEKGKLLKDAMMRRRFLDGLVENEIFIRAFARERRFQRKSSFLIYLELKFKDWVKEYFLMKKVAITVNRKVSDKEIGAAYDKINKEPRYANALARMKMGRVKKFIRSRIIRMRQLKAARKYMEKLKMRYRIEIFEKRL